MKGKKERYFRDVFDRLNDAVLIIHPAQEKIADANPRACSMLGYSREELSSLLIFTVYPEIPKLRAFIQSVLEHGQGWTDELTCLTKTGRTLHCEISASTVDIAGTFYIVASIRDVTERKQMEAAFKENLAQLSRKNRYQTIISTVTQSVHQSINLQEVLE